MTGNGENVDCFHSGFCWSTMQIPIRTVLQVANLHGLAWPAASTLPWASSHFGLLCDLCSCFLLLCPFLGCVIVGDGGWWWWRWARQRLGRVMVLFAEACWWSPEIQKTLSEIKKKYSKLPKGSVVWFEASIVGLDATSQASKHFACLSGGTPLALAAFVGDEVPKIRESRWCSWHRFYMALLCFIAFGCFWRLP